MRDAQHTTVRQGAAMRDFNRAYGRPSHAHSENDPGVRMVAFDQSRYHRSAERERGLGSLDAL
jgi:hypothetical protein